MTSPARPLRVLKFGGTSVGSAERMKETAQIIARALNRHRVLLVVSAMSGVTNLLLDSAQRAARGEAQEGCAAFRDIHLKAFEGLREQLADASDAANRLGRIFDELDQLLHGIQLLRDLSPRVQAHISSLGERASSVLMAALLRGMGWSCLELDPRQYLPCTGPPLEAEPLPERIQEALRPFGEGESPLALLPGFFGGDAEGHVLCLGRGGSDYSAALAAAAVRAEALEIWTDVEGVFSADPRMVPEAFPLPELTYEEAMELAHLGAKVLHPKTIAPARALRIPVWTKNSFHPEAPGTLVQAGQGDRIHGVRGLSFLDGIALLNISGPGMKGVPGVAARALSALGKREISVVLITQCSSEFAMTFAVREQDGHQAGEALRKAFELELETGRLDRVELLPGQAILSAVGEGMRHKTGLAGDFFGALGQARCNVAAIAQGSSERSISIVLDRREGPQALRAIHRRFFGPAEPLEMIVLGTGGVGRRFLELLGQQQGKLKAQGVNFKLVGVGKSRAWIHNEEGLDPNFILPSLAQSTVALDLKELQNWAQLRSQALLVDCTSSESLAHAYPELMEAGFHIVTASKKANSGSQELYNSIRASMARCRRRFRFEANVGAGLPVLGTLQDLLNGGDRIQRIEGVLSGSLSFILGLLEDGLPFSRAVRMALEKGTTEPDPRDDLSGLDVARKVLILHREMGGHRDLDQVRLIGLLPPEFDASGTVESFLDRLPELDDHFAQRVAMEQSQGRRLRFVASATSTELQAGLVATDEQHPLHGVRDGLNAVSFHTDFYQAYPLVVRGFGAGASVTAAAVMADAVKLAREVQL